MQDSEKHFSQPSRNHMNHLTQQDELAEEEQWEAAIPSLITPPRRGLQYALGIGALGGLLAAIIPVAITFIEAPTYQNAVRLGDKMPYSTALTLFWLGVIYLVLEWVIAFLAGVMVGKVAIRRLWGFYAGLLVGAIAYLGYVIVHYIPGYPDGSGAFVVGAIPFILILLLIRALISGLMGLWGVWLTTRRNPYYQRYQA